MFRSDLFKIGLLAVLLGGCGAITASPDLQGSPVPVYVHVDDVWPPEAVERQLDVAQRRFAECGINLTFAETPVPSVSRELFFVPSLETIDGTAIEGRAFALRSPKQAEIAWRTSNGTPLEHKQTAAHELGHLFGLGHAPLHSINLMAPHGCELCRFAARQCGILGESVG